MTILVNNDNIVIIFATKGLVFTGFGKLVWIMSASMLSSLFSHIQHQMEFWALWHLLWTKLKSAEETYQSIIIAFASYFHYHVSYRRS